MDEKEAAAWKEKSAKGFLRYMIGGVIWVVVALLLVMAVLRPTFAVVLVTTLASAGGLVLGNVIVWSIENYRYKKYLKETHAS